MILKFILKKIYNKLVILYLYTITSIFCLQKDNFFEIAVLKNKNYQKNEKIKVIKKNITINKKNH